MAGNETHINPAFLSALSEPGKTDTEKQNRTPKGLSSKLLSTLRNPQITNREKMQIFLIVVAQGRELAFSKPPFGFKIAALFQIFTSEELEVVTSKAEHITRQPKAGEEKG